MQEPSEEVRLQLMKLTLCLMGRGGPSMTVHLADLVAVARAALADASPDIKRAGPTSPSLHLCCLPRGQGLCCSCQIKPRSLADTVG